MTRNIGLSLGADICWPICFEEILNKDEEFSEHHHLLNYGTGGYGVDQISLLMRNSAIHYDRPFIVFSFLTMDLDRAILKVRTGQKPYFERSGDSLALKGVPLYTDPDSFFVENPPQIWSYLWRKFLFSDANFFPENWNANFKQETQSIEKIKYVCELILRDAAEFLKNQHTDYMVLVFETEDQLIAKDHESNWRVKFINETFKKYNVPLPR